MKKSGLLVILSIFAVAPLSFAGTFTNCTPTGSVSDGSGGFFVQGNCDFYHESVYPFSLLTFESSAGSPYTAENYVSSGYIVFTTDPNEYNGQTPDPTAANWVDVLFFQDDISGPQDSAENADLYWGSAINTALYNTVTSSTINGGAFYVQADTVSGSESELAGTNVNFFVFDTLPTTTPEPSTFFMMAAGTAFALWRMRRRRV